MPALKLELILQSKKVTEDDLRREFEIYGTIERIRLVLDHKGKSRGFAFIVYERERDMKGEITVLPGRYRRRIADIYSRLQGR